MEQNQELQTYKLPDGVVVKMGDIPVEIVLGFGRLNQESVRIIEEQCQCRLQPAELDMAVSAEELTDRAVPVEDVPMPQPSYPSGGSAWPQATPVQPPAPPTPQEVEEAKLMRQMSVRLSVAQNTLGMFSQMRLTQLHAMINYFDDRLDMDGEPFEGDNWKLGDHGEEQVPLCRLTRSERRLYDSALSFVANFIDDGYPNVSDQGDASVL